VKVELKKKGKSERAHGMCTWYLQTMVVFSYGKVKSELNHDSQNLLTQLKT
jgi:hypothetical protein